jgi:hypothetical protein
MKFRVELTAGAEDDLAANYRWISANSNEGANRWFNQFLRRLKLLAESL